MDVLSCLFFPATCGIALNIIFIFKMGEGLREPDHNRYHLMRAYCVPSTVRTGFYVGILFNSHKSLRNVLSCLAHKWATEVQLHLGDLLKAIQMWHCWD